jgi:hypothetical protein
LLQLVVWLMLRLVVVPLLLSQNNLQHRLPQHLIPSQFQQPECLWWLPCQVLFFTQPLPWHLEWSALFWLLSMTVQCCRNLTILEIWTSSKVTAKQI